MNAVVVSEQNARHLAGLSRSIHCVLGARPLRSVHFSTGCYENAGEMRTRPEPRSVGSNGLVARDSHPAFFLVSFTSKGRLEFCLLTRGNKERMFFSVLDNLLCHYLAFETAQCAFNRFTLINSNYCHSFVAFLLIRSVEAY